MNIFKTYTFTWWQMGIFKISVICLGAAIGSYFSSFFIDYVNLLIITAIILGLYIGYIAFKK